MVDNRNPDTHTLFIQGISNSDKVFHCKNLTFLDFNKEKHDPYRLRTGHYKHGQLVNKNYNGWKDSFGSYVVMHDQMYRDSKYDFGSNPNPNLMFLNQDDHDKDFVFS